MMSGNGPPPSAGGPLGVLPPHHPQPAAVAAAVAAAAATPPPPRPRQTVFAESVFEAPGRQFRPEKICVILRGLPGSGKSHVARLLRDLENVYITSYHIISFDFHVIDETMP